MFTVCPRCTLTLAVTAEDLRAGQGYVRCGRCLNVFNALLSLSDEAPGADSQIPVYSQANAASSSQISRALESVEQSAPSLPPPPSLAAPQAAIDPTAVTDEHEVLQPQADEALSFAEIIDPLLYNSGSEPSHPQLTTEVSSDGAIENESSLAEGTGTFETIVLEGDAITQTEEFAPQESVDHEIAVLAQRLHAAPANDRQAASAASDTAANDAAANGFAAGLAAESSPDVATDDVTAINTYGGVSPTAVMEADSDAALADLGLAIDPPQTQSVHHRRGWLAGCVLLALLLILQAINYWRDSLASMPSLSAPMTRLYRSLGVPLDPHWDLNAYDIRQQGAIADPVDTHVIHVRLSVANHAPRSQPMPLLRLTLLDRYGKHIAARDLAPEDYWPHGQPPRSFLDHDERIDSEVSVRDQGPDSASFELDVCLRNLHNVIHCAGDTSPPDAGTT